MQPFGIQVEQVTALVHWESLNVERCSAAVFIHTCFAVALTVRLAAFMCLLGFNPYARTFLLLYLFQTSFFLL